MTILERVGRVFRSISGDDVPRSFMTLARERRKPSTSRLYIVETDFAVSEDAYEKIQTHLDELRGKYGLDFLLLEPGFKLKRFDDY